MYLTNLAKMWPWRRREEPIWIGASPAQMGPYFLMNRGAFEVLCEPVTMHELRVMILNGQFNAEQTIVLNESVVRVE